MEAFRYTALELLWFSFTIATLCDGPLSLPDGGDTLPETLTYIHQGSDHTLVTQRATENGIPTVSKSTLHGDC